MKTTNPLPEETAFLQLLQKYQPVEEVEQFAKRCRQRIASIVDNWIQDEEQTSVSASFSIRNQSLFDSNRTRNEFRLALDQIDHDLSNLLSGCHQHHLSRTPSAPGRPPTHLHQHTPDDYWSIDLGDDTHDDDHDPMDIAVIVAQLRSPDLTVEAVRSLTSVWYRDPSAAAIAGADRHLIAALISALHRSSDPELQSNLVAAIEHLFRDALSDTDRLPMLRAVQQYVLGGHPDAAGAVVGMLAQVGRDWPATEAVPDTIQMLLCDAIRWAMSDQDPIANWLNSWMRCAAIRYAFLTDTALPHLLSHLIIARSDAPTNAMITGRCILLYACRYESGRKLLRSDQFDTLLADVIDHLYDGNHDHPEIGSSFLIAIFSSIHFMNTISAFTLNDLVDRVVEPIATRAGPVPAHVLHVLLALGPWRRAAARLAPRLAVLAPDLTDPDRGALIAQLFALVAERAAPYPPLAGNPLWAALSASSANSDDDDDDTDDDSGADVEGQYGRLQRLTERARDAAFAERLLLRRRRSACLCEEDLIEFGRTYRTRLIVADHEVIGIETDDERHDVDDDLIRVRYELVQQLQRRRCRWRSVARDPIRARSLVDLVTEAICHAGAADHPDPILFGNGAAGYEQRLANEFANVCDTLGVIVDHDQFRCFHRMCSTNADHDDDDRSQDHRWRLDRVAVHVLALAAHCTARTGGEPVALARALAARLAASKLGSGSGLASFAARLERIVATLLADIDFMLRRSSIDCQQLAEIWVWSGFQTGPCLRPWLLLAPVTDAGAVFADLVGRLQAGRRHLRRRWAMIGCLTLDDVVDVMSASEPAIDDLERIRARIQSWARTESG